MLCEVRRILHPGGVARFMISNTGVHGGQDIPHLAKLVGFKLLSDSTLQDEIDSVTPTFPIPQPDETFIDFRKPERRVFGSPRVSLLIPAYSPRFFEKCLESAIAQTYENMEIIVCDDSSGPEIEEIAGRLGRIRPLRYERNPTRLKGRGNYKNVSSWPPASSSSTSTTTISWCKIVLSVYSTPSVKSRILSWRPHTASALTKRAIGYPISRRPALSWITICPLMDCLSPTPCSWPDLMW